MKDYRKEMETMKDCLLETGRVVLDYFNQKNYKISMKGVNSPLTEADLVSNQRIIETIQNYFPEDAVLSEESHSSKTDRFKAARVWIIDPIDGTKEFIDGLPEFAISVGLIEEDLPVMGFILNPAKDFFIYGGKSTGVFLNSKEIKPPKEMAVFGLEDLKPALSMNEMEKGLFEDILSKISVKKEQILGSIAYKLGLLASGEFNLVVSYRPKHEWDIAAGISLLYALDYSAFGLDYKPIRLNQKDTCCRGIVTGTKQAVKLFKKNFSH